MVEQGQLTLAEELSFDLILHLSKLTAYEQGCSATHSPVFLPTFLLERCFGAKNGACSKSQDEEEREHNPALHLPTPICIAPVIQPVMVLAKMEETALKSIEKGHGKAAELHNQPFTWTHGPSHKQHGSSSAAQEAP